MSVEQTDKVAAANWYCARYAGPVPYDLFEAFAAHAERARALAIEQAAKAAQIQVLVSGCANRRTKRWGIRREPYFTELAVEAADAVRRLTTPNESTPHHG